VKLSNVAALYGDRLRAQLGQELLALVGIAVGVSLLFAALVANTSLTGSFERVTRGVVGDARFQLAARGEGFSQAKLGEVQRLPGVKAAAAILEVRGEARGPRASRAIVLFGVTPDFALFDGSLTRGFSYGFIANIHAIALPTPLVSTLGVALGQLVEFDLSGRAVYARVGAKLQRSDVGGLFNSPIAIAPLRYAQILSGHLNEISRVFVLPEPGRDDDVRRELMRLARGRADVRPADFDSVLFRQASQPTSQSTSMFSAFSALVGFLFALSAVLLTVPQRRRLIADLQIEGYGPSTVVKILLFDALLLGVVASALGIVLGDQLAHRLFDATPSFLQMAFPFGSERITTIGDVAFAAASGITASCVAVLTPMATAVLGIDEPAWSVRAKGLLARYWLVAAGLAFLLTGAAITASTPESSSVGVAGLACFTVAMLFLLPSLLHLLVLGIDMLTRGLRSIVPFLAITDLRDPSTRLRSLAVAATGAVAVLGSVALQGAHADLQRGLDRTSHDLAAIGDVWVVTPGTANLLATAPFQPPPLKSVAGIESLHAYRGSFLNVGNRRVWVFGSPVNAKQPIPRGDATKEDFSRIVRRLRAGGWAVVSTALARDLHLDAGSRFLMPSPVPITLHIAALSTNMGWPPGAIVVNADDYARAWGSSDVSAVQATLSPGVSASAGSRALRSALGSHSGLVVQTAADRERDQRAASREGLTRLTQIAALVLVSAMIAMAAAMAGMIWQRRAFLAGMKIEGYTTAELWRSLLLEAVVLIGAGCGIGAIFGLAGQSLLSRALTSITGFPVVYAPAVRGALLSCAAVMLISVAIVAFFGQRAARIGAQSGLR
jgi:putative ABC transport system permease protein